MEYIIVRKLIHQGADKGIQLEHQKTEYPDTHIHESNPVAFGPAAVPWLCLFHPIFLLSSKRPGKGCPGRLLISFMFVLEPVC